MKKILSMILALTMLFALVACGGGEKTVEAPDLTAYYNDFLATLPEESTPATMDLEGEMLEGMYPGISEFTFKQGIFKVAAIGAVAFEFALVECESAEDAEAVAKLFETRKENQINGGAFYEETANFWRNGEVIVNGNVVALIVGGEHQSAAVEAYNALYK